MRSVETATSMLGRFVTTLVAYEITNNKLWNTNDMVKGKHHENYKHDCLSSTSLLANRQ